MNLFKKTITAIRSGLSEHFYFRATPTILFFIAFAIVFTWACGPASDDPPPTTEEPDYYVYAIDDAANTDMNTVIGIFPVGNDERCCVVQSLRVTSNASHGSAAYVTRGWQIEYTPNRGYTGTDQFTYEVCMENETCDTAVVVVGVGVEVTAEPTPDPIVEAVDDTMTTNQSEAVTSTTLLDNDTVTPRIHSFELYTFPEDGTVTITDTALTYTPNRGFFGTDSFEYDVCANATRNYCDRATVTVTVNAKPSPVAVDDDASTNSGVPVDIDLTVNDTHADGTIDDTSITIVSAPSGGNVVDNDDGTVTYTPNTYYSGTDTFTYTVDDTIGNRSNEATVSVEVATTGQPPFAVDDDAATNSGVPVDIDLTGNDTHADGTIDDTSLTIVSNPSGGNVVDKGNGTVTYTPNTYYTGTDTFTYTVDDTLGKTSNEATVSVRVAYTNFAPTARNDSVSVAINQSVMITVLINDTDPNDFILPGSVTLGTPPSNGNIYINPTTGVVTYTPNAGYHGSDSFTYAVSDGWGVWSNLATVYIDIPVTCGDGYCSYPPETTETCGTDCQCINDGVCNSPVEGDNCLDCAGSPPSTCDFESDSASCAANGGTWKGSFCDCCKFAGNVTACFSGDYTDFCWWNDDSEVCLWQEQG